MKIGMEVQIYLDKEIEIAKKNKNYINSNVLELWEKINGKTGIISKINNNEIWIKSRRTNKERIFTRDTLKLFDT